MITFGPPDEGRGGDNPIRQEGLMKLSFLNHQLPFIHKTFCLTPSPFPRKS